MTLFLLPILIAVFLAINMGASGAAPAFAAPYGADLLRKQAIPGLFALFVFLGAVLAGQKVMRTLGGEILPAAAMQLALVSVVLFSVSLSLFVANLLHVPQSTSQSTVFALVGSALYLDKLQTEKLMLIVPTWFVLPLSAFAATYVFTRYIYSRIKRVPQFDYHQLAETRFWKYATIASSCSVAFSIGANNVANASGPLTSLFANHFHVAERDPNFSLLLLFTAAVVAPCFGIGSSLLGHGVMETTAREITELGPLAATFISFLTATLLLLASTTWGIPTSLVQLNTACIFAVGVWRDGFKKAAIESAVPKLLTVWLVAPLFALGFAWALTALVAWLGMLA